MLSEQQMQDALDNVRRCANCRRVWRSYKEVPCPNGDGCDECAFQLKILGDTDGAHTKIDLNDYDEVVTRRCDHGMTFAWNCRGCGSQVSGYSVGSAGGCGC